MSDDGCSDQFSTDYDDTTMEIIVETLTGTTFEMTVSAADTIGSIKHKIQRVEGISDINSLCNEQQKYKSQNALGS